MIKVVIVPSLSILKIMDSVTHISLISFYLPSVTVTFTHQKRDKSLGPSFSTFLPLFRVMRHLPAVGLSNPCLSHSFGFWQSDMFPWNYTFLKIYLTSKTHHWPFIIVNNFSMIVRIIRTYDACHLLTIVPIIQEVLFPRRWVHGFTL